MGDPYIYLGDVASAICENGHFSSIAHGNCDTCGRPRFKLRILTNLTRLPVKIYGHLVNPDGFIRIEFEDGTTVIEDEHSFRAGYVILDVFDQSLTISRIFSWGLVTR